MEAKINTKSNFNGLNGKWFQVQEIVGTRVTCIVPTYDINKYIDVDFTLKEISEMNTSDRYTNK